MEYGEIEVEIKKSILIRNYAIKVPYGCNIISSDQNLMFSRRFDMRKKEDYIIIPHDQIPKQLQISNLKLRYSCKSSKKNILEMLQVEDKENFQTLPEYKDAGCITITNLSDYEVMNLIVTKKIEIHSNIELNDIEFKILPEPSYDARVIDGGLVGRINRNNRSVEKIKRILGLEWSLDIKPHKKETFEVYYRYLETVGKVPKLKHPKILK